MAKRKNRVRGCEAVKSGLEDENPKSLKIDENHVLYRENVEMTEIERFWGQRGLEHP